MLRHHVSNHSMILNTVTTGSVPRPKHWDPRSPPGAQQGVGFHPVVPFSPEPKLMMVWGLYLDPVMQELRRVSRRLKCLFSRCLCVAQVIVANLEILQQFMGAALHGHALTDTIPGPIVEHDTVPPFIICSYHTTVSCEVQ
jgi:hypothetical protein